MNCQEENGLQLTEVKTNDDQARQAVSLVARGCPPYWQVLPHASPCRTRPENTHRALRCIGHGSRGRSAANPHPRLEVGMSDATNWEPAQLRELRAELQAKPELGRQAKQAFGHWPEPKPLGGDLPPVASFDLALLPMALRPWAADIAERMQIPIDFPE